MSEYQPGTVAMLRAENGHEFLAVRTFGGSSGDYWSAPKGWPKEASGCEIIATKPLVVLDLSPHEVMRALEALRGSNGMVAMQVADKLEAAARPPKPAEPKGLGAVVEDAKGTRWVHFGNGCWIKEVPNAGLLTRTWDEIDAVREVQP